jgi:hypothetical protein
VFLRILRKQKLLFIKAYSDAFGLKRENRKIYLLIGKTLFAVNIGFTPTPSLRQLPQR